MWKITTGKMRLAILLVLAAVAVYRAGWQVPRPIVEASTRTAHAPSSPQDLSR
jgi:hypothetical protein